MHPQVKRVFHENFLLKICKDKSSLLEHVSKKGINPTDNWGEKVPYYPSARRVPIIKYCEKWNSYFTKQSRILHIVRHPYDVAFSNVKKFKNINKLGQPLRVYKGVVPTAIRKIDEMNSSFTFKYEDLLLFPDETMIDICRHCGLEIGVDFQERMRSIKNPKYQKIDSSRAFAYREQKIKAKYDLDSVIEVLNTIDGIKYDL